MFKQEQISIQIDIHRYSNKIKRLYNKGDQESHCKNTYFRERVCKSMNTEIKNKALLLLVFIVMKGIRSLSIIDI